MGRRLVVWDKSNIPIVALPYTMEMSALCMENASCILMTTCNSTSWTTWLLVMGHLGPLIRPGILVVQKIFLNFWWIQKIFLKISTSPIIAKILNLKNLVRPNWKWRVQDSSRRVARISVGQHFHTLSIIILF